VKKIIHILLALGVLLGLTAVAAPVAAAPCTCPTTMSTFDILTPPFCAGDTSTYTLGTVTPITVPVTLLPGADYFSVDFPADTDLSSVLAGGVTVTGVAPVVFPAASPTAITVTDQHLEFMIPAAWLAASPIVPAGQTITITVAGVINPTTADTYCLYIDYMEACGGGGCIPTQFACATYVVSPYTKVVDFHFDFSPTFTGLAEDYIPAFKACGMAGFGTPIGPDWYYDFDLILRDENGGCNDPCTTPSKFWFEVTECPAGETINFVFDAASVHCAATTYALTDADIGTEFSLIGCWAGWPPTDVIWGNQLHVSSPGDYELTFYLQCPAGGCPLCGGPTIVAEEPLAISAYQYLDAYKIDLYEKWNLISLPLFPYDTDIAAVMSAMDRIDQLKSVWYFGQCEDPDPDEGVWHSEAYDATAGTFSGDVDDMVAGKAYWVRTLEPSEAGYVAGTNGLWFFGTHAIMPDPTGVDMGYFDVCEGWNMVGFKPPWVAGAPVNQWDDDYLWNFNTGVMDTVHYGLIYQWDPTTLPGDWNTYLPATLSMVPGEGYWIPFDGDSEIYPSS
jgi:hypothetical protein